MKKLSKQALIGSLLVLAGIVFLLQQIFQLPIGGLFVSMFFLAGGLIFLYVVMVNKEHWWALIPGSTLVGLAVLIACSDLAPRFTDKFGGSIFLGAVALGFVGVYLLKPSNWWAVIPAGAVSTIALVAGIQSGHGMLQGGVFFLGIGATFAALGLLPNLKTEKWPWIPASVCFVLGTLILVGSGALINSIFGWIWAVGFVAAGVYLVVRSFMKKE
jgi:hypothetical protein